MTGRPRTSRTARRALTVIREPEPRFETAEGSVEGVLRLLDERGRARYDESVTQLEHALQASALACAEGADDTLVVAALLHDVGHLLLDDHSAEHDLQHEAVGALFLRRWFGPEVSTPVALHVAAKRYLVGRDPAYGATLSPASSRSLILQGGPFDAVTCKRFARLPHAEAAIAVRRWDDRAKIRDLPVPSLAAFVPVLWRVVRLPR